MHPIEIEITRPKEYCNNAAGKKLRQIHARTEMILKKFTHLSPDKKLVMGTREENPEIILIPHDSKINVVHLPVLAKYAVPILGSTHNRIDLPTSLESWQLQATRKSGVNASNHEIFFREWTFRLR